MNRQYDNPKGELVAHLRGLVDVERFKEETRRSLESFAAEHCDTYIAAARSIDWQIVKGDACAPASAEEQCALIKIMYAHMCEIVGILRDMVEGSSPKAKDLLVDIYGRDIGEYLKKRLDTYVYWSEPDEYPPERDELFHLLDRFGETAIAYERGAKGGLLSDDAILRSFIEGLNGLEERQAYNVSDFSNFRDLYDQYMYRELSKGEFAGKLGVSRSTLDKLLEDFTAPKGK